MQLTLRPIGNSAGLILPKKLLNKINASLGDKVTIIETKDGFEVKPYDTEVSEQIDAAQKVMKKYRNTLRKLADS